MTLEIQVHSSMVQTLNLFETFDIGVARSDVVGYIINHYCFTNYI
jgi:hypothetical protein